MESEDSRADRPVLVVVRHEKGVLSWQLPLLVQVPRSYTTSSCPILLACLVLVVVRHEKGVLSWQLPLLVQVPWSYTISSCSTLLVNSVLCPSRGPTLEGCPVLVVTSPGTLDLYYQFLPYSTSSSPIVQVLVL